MIPLKSPLLSKHPLTDCMPDYGANRLNSWTSTEMRDLLGWQRRDAFATITSIGVGRSTFDPLWVSIKQTFHGFGNTRRD